MQTQTNTSSFLTLVCIGTVRCDCDRTKLGPDLADEHSAL